MKNFLRNIKSQSKSTLSLNELQLLEEISLELLAKLSLEELLEDAVNKIIRKCRFLGGIVFLIEDDYLYAQAIGGGKGVGLFLKLIKQPLAKLKISLDEKHNNFVVNSVLTGETLVSDDLKDFTRGVLNDTVAGLAGKITDTKSCVSIPVLYNGEAIGAMFFSKNVKDNFKKELKLLSLIGVYLGISIGNARTFEEIKKYSDELIKSNSALQEALETVNDLRRQEKDMVDILGHELKTPLTSLYGTLQLLDRVGKSKTEIDKTKLSGYTNKALGFTQKEIKLLNSLLEATKLDAKKMVLTKEKFNLYEIVMDSFQSFKLDAKAKKLKYNFKCKDKNIFVEGDKIRMDEVIDNLISNSLKYTPSGSIELILIKQDNKAIFEIRDTGIGIPSDEIKKIGKKFYRTTFVKESTSKEIATISGSGLGLYVVTGILKEMKSKLEIESEIGKGSTFRFVLHCV